MCNIPFFHAYFGYNLVWLILAKTGALKLLLHVVSNSFCRSHLGQVISDMFVGCMLYAYCTYGNTRLRDHTRGSAASTSLAILFLWIASGILWFLC